MPSGNKTEQFNAMLQQYLTKQEKWLNVFNASKGANQGAPIDHYISPYYEKVQQLIRQN